MIAEHVDGVSRSVKQRGCGMKLKRKWLDNDVVFDKWYERHREGRMNPNDKLLWLRVMMHLTIVRARVSRKAAPKLYRQGSPMDLMMAADVRMAREVLRVLDKPEVKG